MHERIPTAPLAGALAFPGKVLAAPDGRIFVADSGHHRVLILDERGAVLETIGSGLRGHGEGKFAEAALDDPQGLALEPGPNGALYIADARAHAVYCADLGKGVLRKIAGTFQPGEALLGTKMVPANELALCSPWDLALRGSELYLALAGSHQIGLLRLDTGAMELLAGDGREALENGPGPTASLAQPSGLSLQGDVLYVADRASSGVRAIDLRSRRVYTLAGEPGLLDCGDEVGPVWAAMLKHPRAVVATRADGLIVADTDNDKLKRFSPDGMRLEPFFEGAADSRLARPAGLSLMPSGEILVADTDNHRIVMISRDGAQAFALEIAAAHG